MGFMTTLNKIFDAFMKFGLLLVAISVAIVPVLFLAGHETLHQQMWRDDFADHALRMGQVE